MYIYLFLWIIFFSFSSALNAKVFHFSTLDFDSPSINKCGEVIKQAYENLGHEVIISKYPSARAMDISLKGNNDGELCRFNYFDQGQKLIKVSPAIIQMQLYAYSNKELPKLESVDDLNRYKIGVIRGTAYSSYVINNKNLKVIQLSNSESLFKMLQKKRIDLAIYYDIESRPFHLFYKYEYQLSKLFPVDGLYHFMNKKNESYKNAISKEISKIINLRSKD